MRCLSLGTAFFLSKFHQQGHHQKKNLRQKGKAIAFDTYHILRNNLHFNLQLGNRSSC